MFGVVELSIIALPFPEITITIIPKQVLLDPLASPLTSLADFRH